METEGTVEPRGENNPALNNFATFFLALWFGPFLALSSRTIAEASRIPDMLITRSHFGMVLEGFELYAVKLTLLAMLLLPLGLTVLLHLKAFVLGARANITFYGDLVTICVTMLGSALVGFPFTAALLDEEWFGTPLFSFRMTFCAWIVVTACLVAASPLRRKKLLQWFEG